MSKRCSAQNRSGKRCGAWAITGGTECALHSDPKRAAEMGSKHGRKMTLRSRPDELELSYRPLKSVEEVGDLLEETINRVRQGSLELRAANTIGFLAGIRLKALAQQAEAPETSNGEGSQLIYTSLFQRLAEMPNEPVFDLYPPSPQKDAGVASDPLPAAGESVDDPPIHPNNHPGVITVEVG